MTGKLHPSDGPRGGANEGEQEVYEALRRYLPDGWEAWHSVRLMTRGGAQGEGDFVLAVPDKGLLVLEVKGGDITIDEHGHWCQNRRQMKEAPLDQADDYVRDLVEEIARRAGTRPRFEVAAVFPDCPSVDGLKEGRTKGRVFGGNDLSWFDQALKDFVQRIEWRTPPVTATQWVPQLDEIWGRSWVSPVRLAESVKVAERQKLQLDHEQTNLLDCFEQNPRGLISGGAGSGKTVVAQELCRRRAAQGQSVLYTCFTDALGLAVQRFFEAECPPEHRVRAVPIRRFARELLAAKGIATPETAEFWEQACFKAACEALPEPGARPDLLVVDEGQDLAENEWMFVTDLMKDRPIWVFRDTRQKFWAGRTVPNEVAGIPFTFTLPGQHRNPPAVEWFASLFDGTRTDLEKRKVRRPDFDPRQLRALRVVPTKAEKLARRVAHEIDQLRAQGAKPEDIAVITLLGQTSSELFDLPKLGSHAVARADRPEAAGATILDTFLRFKGLDRPFIIVTEVARALEHEFETRMHIAATRATVRLTIVCAEECLGGDARLKAAAALGAGG